MRPARGNAHGGIGSPVIWIAPQELKREICAVRGCHGSHGAKPSVTAGLVPAGLGPAASPLRIAAKGRRCGVGRPIAATPIVRRGISIAPNSGRRLAALIKSRSGFIDLRSRDPKAPFQITAIGRRRRNGGAGGDEGSGLVSAGRTERRAYPDRVIGDRSVQGPPRAPQPAPACARQAVDRRCAGARRRSWATGQGGDRCRRNSCPGSPSKGTRGDVAAAAAAGQASPWRRFGLHTPITSPPGISRP